MQRHGSWLISFSASSPLKQDLSSRSPQQTWSPITHMNTLYIAFFLSPVSLFYVPSSASWHYLSDKILHSHLLIRYAFQEVQTKAQWLSQVGMLSMTDRMIYFSQVTAIQQYFPKQESLGYLRPLISPSWIVTIHIRVKMALKSPTANQKPI